MGGGSWNDSDYRAAAARRAASGQSAFSYSQAQQAAGANAQIHDDLNPLGVKVRESRDSDDHPNSVAVAVLFDVTGSMGGNPMILQTELAQLFGLLLRKGYLDDPQILTGAYGDLKCDLAPLQVGQFESDIRVDEQLRQIFLEGNGGGNGGESAGVGMYFLARHTSIDCFEKRGQKGYAFFVGDEISHDALLPSEIKERIGDDIDEPLRMRQIIDELEKTYNVFFLVINTGAAIGQGSLKFWRNLLGERALLLDDPHQVSSVIAATIGMLEEAVDLDGAVADLVDVGVTPQLAKSVGTALKELAGTTTAIAKTTGSGLPSLDSSGGSERI